MGKIFRSMEMGIVFPQSLMTKVPANTLQPKPNSVVPFTTHDNSKRFTFSLRCLPDPCFLFTDLQGMSCGCRHSAQPLPARDYFVGQSIINQIWRKTLPQQPMTNRQIGETGLHFDCGRFCRLLTLRTLSTRQFKVTNVINI